MKKLTPELCNEILEMYQVGFKGNAIAKELQLSNSTVYRVINPQTAVKQRQRNYARRQAAKKNEYFPPLRSTKSRDTMPYYKLVDF